MLTTLALALTLHVEPIETPNAAELVGEWRWSTTGTVTNLNSNNGTHAGGGRGMSKHYTFNADGTFEQDSLIQIMNDAHRRSAFITAEGLYEVRGDNIRFTVLKGHQHGEDNMMLAGNYDARGRRPQDQRDVSFHRANGERALVLLLGQSLKDDMIYFPAPRGK